MRERDIFIEALQKADPAERSASLDAACASDDALRQRLLQLLAEHEKQKSFLLDAPPHLLANHASATIDQPTNEATGALIGPYKLVEQIGEGGMGTVWMAQQTEPVKRVVALKLIKAGMDTRSVLARFEAERQALALMDHPNIAKVLEAGETPPAYAGDSQRPYFVMELVKGISITTYCDKHHLTPRQRLELFVPVCHAIQHAHQKGIIHRDLKPSNVLVALYDGKPVPKVIDFGVAKAAGQPLTDKTLVTGFGAIVGTLEYMSPEQAEINQLDIDTRSDIYSLGVLLYELLTGTTPLERKRVNRSGIVEALRIIREEEVPTLSHRLGTTEQLPAIAANRGLEPAKLTKLVCGELDWIVMKALDKDRNRRYETANGFAADVQRYLADETVQACPLSASYRFRKFARRNKRAVATATAAALVVLAAVTGLATSNYLIARAKWDTAKALDEANGARDDLKQTKEIHRVDAYFGRIALAYRELSADNLGGALELLRLCPEDLRDWEWNCLMRLCRVEPVILQDNTDVNSIAFSSDGELIAAACGDGTVKLWNIKTGKVIKRFDAHPDAVFSVAFHPDGKHLATVGYDQRVKVWDLTTDPAEKVFERPCYAVHNNGTAYTVAFSPGDGRQLAAGSDDAVKVWDWEKEQLLHTFPGHLKPRAISVAFSRDGKRLASGSGPGSVKLLDPEAGGELRNFTESRGVAALAFGPDGGRLATASFTRCAEVLDTTTGERLHELRHSGLVLGVAFHPEGRRLASVGEDKIVHLWDVSTGREVLGLSGHTSQCGCVAFSPDGFRLASASKDGTIRIWDATPLQDHERQENLSVTPHGDEVWSVAVSPVDGQKIVSAGWGPRSAKVWNARTGKVSVPFSGHTGIVFCVALHPDGKWIASAGLDNELLTVKVWDAQTGQLKFDLPPGPEEYLAVAFSPDRRYLVTGRSNGKVEIWDAPTGDKVGTLGTHERRMRVRGVAFSPDGLHLASASGDGKVYLWDATSLEGKKEARGRHILDAHNQGNGLTVAFSPDGRRLVTGGEKHTAKIWDVETGRVLNTLEGHSGDVCVVVFSPDSGGRWVASAGEDSTVKVWDSHTGKLLKSFRGHTGLVGTLAFLDGRTLISGSRDHTVKFWDLTQLEEAPDR